MRVLFSNFYNKFYQYFLANNPAFGQFLGLCPLLGISSSVVNSLGLGLSTFIVVLSSNLLIYFLRDYINETIRLPIFVLMIASLTSCIALIMQAYAFALYQVVGIFIPLIVTNCVILSQAETCAYRKPLSAVFNDSLSTGLGFLFALLTLGFVRELLGTGKVFAHMDWLFGISAKDFTITFWKENQSFLISLLPPGAFIITGFLIALKNYLASMAKKL